MKKVSVSLRLPLELLLLIRVRLPGVLLQIFQQRNGKCTEYLARISIAARRIVVVPGRPEEPQHNIKPSLFVVDDEFIIVLSDHSQRFLL